jgi:flavin-dependent dehydrogenase
MTERLKADVVVGGAGPVGLTLAMDLTWRGVDLIVLESRAQDEPPRVEKYGAVERHDPKSRRD